MNEYIIVTNGETFEVMLDTGTNYQSLGVNNQGLVFDNLKEAHETKEVLNASLS